MTAEVKASAISVAVLAPMTAVSLVERLRRVCSSVARTCSSSSPIIASESSATDLLSCSANCGKPGISRSRFLLICGPRRRRLRADLLRAPSRRVGQQGTTTISTRQILHSSIALWQTAPLSWYKGAGAECKMGKRTRRRPPVVLMIDTSVWLDLAKDYSQRSLLSALEDLVRMGQISLLTPKLVI